jgi:cytochrome c-type biogenesis protein CcmH
MIWFWLVAGLLALAAVAVLLRPLLRRSAAGEDEAGAVVAMFRRQLADVEAEAAQGRLAPEEEASARAELTRRMLAAVDRGAPAAVTAPRDSSWRIGAAVGIAALLPAAALAIYAAVGAPGAIERGGSAAAPHSPAEIAAAADQLKARLEREPGHADGWALLGRTFAALGRFADARDAYGRAIGLEPAQKGLHAELGEVLVVEAKGTVTPAAEAEFAKAAADPRSRFYEAEAAWQRGDQAAAEKGLRALLADAPADAPWRKGVAARLAEIAPGKPEATPTPGPGARDIAAAQSMSPEERQAMIRSMVARLASRLEAHPDDKEGWARLAHAYDVLGEPEKAAAARARAE